jgi:hypothetical protein
MTFRRQYWRDARVTCGLRGGEDSWGCREELVRRANGAGRITHAQVPSPRVAMNPRSMRTRNRHKAQAMGADRADQCVVINPKLWARATACARFSAPSLMNIFLTCDFTVSGVTSRERAISLLERP